MKKWASWINCGTFYGDMMMPNGCDALDESDSTHEFTVEKFEGERVTRH